MAAIQCRLLASAHWLDWTANFADLVGNMGLNVVKVEVIDGLSVTHVQDQHTPVAYNEPG